MLTKSIVLEPVGGIYSDLYGLWIYDYDNLKKLWRSHILGLRTLNALEDIDFFRSNLMDYVKVFG